MINFRFGRTALCAIALSALLSACGNKNENQSSSGNSANSANTGISDQFPLPTPPAVAKCMPGVRGGRIVIATFTDPKTFNPITASEMSSMDITYRINSGLLLVDSPTEQPRPGICESWSVEPDNKTWTFHMRKGLRWSDGQPLTADDVVFTWNDIIYNTNIDNVTRDQFQIDGKFFTVTNLDDLTVRVVTPDVYAPFLEFFGVVPIMPRHILAKSVADKTFLAAYAVNTPASQVVGCGPFRLKDFKQGQYVVMERNPYFWEVDSNGTRLPYADTAIYEIVPDMNAMSLKFLNGEVDLQEVVRPEEYEHFKTESAKGKFRVLDLGPSAERDMLTFNQNPENNPQTGKPRIDPVKSKWFRNTKFRQAISYAIDRDAIVNSALAGLGAPFYGFCQPGATNWYNPNLMKYPHDLAKAKALLAEIGIKDRGDGTLVDSDGNVVAFTLNTNAGNDRRSKSSVIIQEDLKRLGIQVTFQPLEFNTLISRFTDSQDYDCILLGWAGGPADPAYSMNILPSYGFNHEWYRSQKKPSTDWEARIDYLMNAQLKTMDHDERKKYYDEVQAILAEQMPMIPTTSRTAFAAARTGLENVRGTTLDPNPVAWNLEELYYKK